VADLFGYLNLAAFTTLALVALREWRLGRSPAARWAALAFGALAVVVLVGRLLPEDPGAFLERTVERSLVAVLLLFPYLLFRFAAALRPVSRRLGRALGLVTLVLVLVTFLAPAFPDAGEQRPLWFQVYLGAFLVHWAVLSSAVALRLWRAGRAQPSVARRRMRMLSLAAAILTVSLFASAAAAEPGAGVGVAGAALAFVSAIAFLLALAPPWFVRVLWRRPEEERLQRAVGGLMRATSEEEVAERVLEPTARLVGARAVALLGDDGRLVGETGLDAAERQRLESGGDQVADDVGRVDLEGGGVLLVWMSQYAPFFGGEELALLRTLGELTGLALDRARLFAAEREVRAALERADVVKSNFVALAAHELRAPVAAVHGLAETLHARGPELSEDRRVELRRLLLGQTTRLRLLVEQLLDLSRLEADAVRIDPEPLLVRARLEEVVVTVLGEAARAVEIDVDPELEAMLDGTAIDRIVGNLVANARRYGSPPIRISAELRDRHFRLTVEDSGPGVPDELVPELFERFTRGDEARAGGTGTGLGLAIARSYAQAHEGDLLYEQAEPHGARFQLVVPVHGRDTEAHVLRLAGFRRTR
jgi:signal transduction histidine kinase